MVSTVTHLTRLVISGLSSVEYLTVPSWYASAHITQVDQAMVCCLVRQSQAEIPTIGETKSLIIRYTTEVYQKGTILVSMVT